MKNKDYLILLYIVLCSCITSLTIVGILYLFKTFIINDMEHLAIAIGVLIGMVCISLILDEMETKI